jgi:hypothetical protein
LPCHDCAEKKRRGQIRYAGWQRSLADLLWMQ